MKLDPKVYRGAAERLRQRVNQLSCMAIANHLERPYGNLPEVWAYVSFTCRDGKPEWWDYGFGPRLEEYRTYRIAALEAFASYLERTGGEL